MKAITVETHQPGSARWEEIPEPDMATMVIKGKTMKSVDVDWKEFYYTNCPLISASNVDQELG